MPDLDTDFVDTPRGVLTPGGLLFHVTVESLYEWAGELFQHVSLREILAGVSAWQSVPSTIVLWLSPLAMLFLNPWLVAVLAVVLVPVLRAVSLPLINPPMISGIRYLALPGVQGLYYIAFLTLLSRVTSPLHVFVALGIFVLLRTGIADAIFARVGNWLSTALYKLAPDDISLRALIISSAAQYGVQLPGYEEFGSRVNPFKKSN